MRKAKSALVALVCAVLVYVIAAGAIAQDSESVSAEDGVYTVEQADRGAATFNGRCAACHGENLQGTPGGPSLTGANFNYAFGDKTVADLVNFMVENMPPEAPGSLTRQQYTNIAAHILRGNEFPEGESGLPVAPEEQLQITIPKR